MAVPLQGARILSIRAAAAVTINLASQTKAFTITGSTNGDAITGGGGADTISGGAGADTITGGAGADSLSGGADNDAFILADGDFAACEVIDDSGGNLNPYASCLRDKLDLLASCAVSQTAAGCNWE